MKKMKKIILLTILSCSILNAEFLIKNKLNGFDMKLMPANMTGIFEGITNPNTTPISYSEISSFEGAGSTAFENLFDNNNATGWYSDSYITALIKFSFEDPLVVNKYSFIATPTDAAKPRLWTFEGSYDGNGCTTFWKSWEYI